jgi:predicted secreted protein
MSRLAMSLFLLAACAAPQETRGTTTAQPGTTQPASATSSEDEQECHEEVPTGSHVSRTVCRSRSQKDREREQGQDFQRKAGFAPNPKRPD